jgi:Uma2 family endonuclease
MGESLLQTFVSQILMSMLGDYFAGLSRPVLVGGNQFFYYRRGDPRACVCPDVYVIDGETHAPVEVPCWKTWEHDGKAPTLAIEVVSAAYHKDYSEHTIQRYQELGVGELVRYDPEFPHRGDRRLLTHFTRDDAGQLVQQVTAPDRVRLSRFDFWLVRHTDMSLRIGLGPHGDALWPTGRERIALAAERALFAETEAERAAVKQAEAEAEIERLRAELARLRGEAAS